MTIALGKAARGAAPDRLPLRLILAQRGIDGVALLVLPSVIFILALFVYPFLYGLVLSFEPKTGGWLRNYQHFFAEPFLYKTIWTTLQLAVPATLVNILLSVPVAMRVRLMRRQRVLTTILVLPITLGTVLIAEGLLNYLGPQGWLNRVVLLLGLSPSPLRLVHNYWGVFLSLIISGFPFTFLLTLSYITGIDPSLEQAAATLGANARARFRHIFLPLLAQGLAIAFCLVLRADLCGVPVRRPARCAGGADAGHHHRRLSGGLRAIRLLAGLGDRHDHGRRAARHRRCRAGGARPGLSRPGRVGEGMRAVKRDGKLSARLWTIAVWALVIFFVVNLAAMIATVVVNSLGTRWLGTWLPAGFTTKWYFAAWGEFQLDDVLIVTFQVVGAVVLLSALLGVPAAYALARRDFPGKKLVTLLFLLPLLVPSITFGIPLATVLYKAGLAGSMSGVILANLVPAVPFVILVMIPFVEQIDPRIEAAARVFGAGTGRMFVYVLLPLLAPGVLAALLLVLVRTIAMFELTFFTAGPTSQTLVVALYYAVYAAGVRAGQSIDAMAVVYMVTTLVWLLVALRFVNPTQIVTRAKREQTG